MGVSNNRVVGVVLRLEKELDNIFLGFSSVCDDAVLHTYRIDADIIVNGCFERPNVGLHHGQDAEKEGLLEEVLFSL